MRVLKKYLSSDSPTRNESFVGGRDTYTRSKLLANRREYPEAFDTYQCERQSTFHKCRSNVRCIHHMVCLPTDTRLIMHGTATRTTYNSFSATKNCLFDWRQSIHTERNVTHVVLHCIDTWHDGVAWRGVVLPSNPLLEASADEMIEKERPIKVLNIF